MIIDAPKREQISDLRALWREAFGDTDVFLDSFFDKVFSYDRCRCAIADGRVVSALYWFDCEYGEKKIAYLYAIATLEEYRGKGICAALMNDTHAHLRSRGYSLAMLVPASDGLFDFYSRIGYKNCTCISENIVFASKTESVKLWRVSSKEYGIRRRELLPSGSVIQEGESLALLDMTAELYMGDGVLLAAQRPNEYSDARIVEFLGDVEEAPKIIRALGYDRAMLRAQGEGREFTMSLSLDGSEADKPKYFGLAFD